jgi:sedoheptulokinase
MTNEVVTPRLGEIRPLTEDKYIFVGASLCGGRAYAILKSFFSMCADFLGGSDEDLYSKMDALAETARNAENPLFVNCEFCGTREDPDSRGSIEDISADNFTPANLIYGVLDGVANELYDMYEQAMFSLVFSHENLICSGNGLRKSDLWRKIFEDHFSMSAELPLHSEEAAVGACVFSGAASGIFKDIKASQDALLR